MTCRSMRVWHPVFKIRPPSDYQNCCCAPFMMNFCVKLPIFGWLFANFRQTHPFLKKIYRKKDLKLESKNPPIWVAFTHTFNVLCTLTEQKLRTHARKLITLRHPSSLQQIPTLGNTSYFLHRASNSWFATSKSLFKHFHISDWSMTSFYAVSALSCTFPRGYLAGSKSK